MSTSLAAQLLRIRDIPKINLALAIYHASKSSKEAPWYGAWGLFLQQLDDYAFHGDQLGITTTVFFPQHPLTAKISDIDEIIDPPSSPCLDDVDAMNDESDPEESPGPEIGGVSPSAEARKMGAGRIDEIIVGLHSRPLQRNALDFESDDDSDAIVTYSDPAPFIRPTNVQKPTTSAITLSSPPSSDPLSSYNATDTFSADQQTTTYSDGSTRKPHNTLAGVTHAYPRKRLRTRSMISDYDRPVEGAGPRASSALFSIPDSAATLSSSAQLQLKRILQLRSTNIPDFIRYIFRVDARGIHERVDLIVENKARRDVRIVSQAHSTLLQATEQAIHAFAEDPTTKVIGTIVAICDFWRYAEILRDPEAIKELEARVREAQNKDTPYEPSERSPSSSSNDYQSSSPAPDNTWDNPALEGSHSELQRRLKEIFPKGVLLKIGDEETPGAIALIMERLREMNPEFWPTMDEGTPTDDNDSEGSEGRLNWGRQPQSGGDSMRGAGQGNSDTLGDDGRGMGDEDTDSSDESEDDPAEEGEEGAGVDTDGARENDEGGESDNDY